MTGSMPWSLLACGTYDSSFVSRWLADGTKAQSDSALPHFCFSAPNQRVEIFRFRQHDGPLPPLSEITSIPHQLA